MHLQNGGQNSKMKHFHEMNRRWIWFFFDGNFYAVGKKKSRRWKRLPKIPG